MISQVQLLFSNVDDDLNVWDGEEPSLAVDTSFQPILIDSTQQSYRVAFFEAQLSLVFSLKVVQRFSAWLACSYKQPEKPQLA